MTTPAQFEAARLMRDSARDDLWDVMPELPREAVSVTVSPHDLTLVANIRGDITPYSQDDVAYCLGALNVTLAGVEASL